MKVCDYCGRKNDEPNDVCLECGTLLAGPNSSNEARLSAEQAADARFAQTLLHGRPHRLGWLAICTIHNRALGLELLSLGAIAAALALGAVGWSFAVGFAFGWTVLGVLRLWLATRLWHRLQLWIDWQQVESIASGSAVAPTINKEGMHQVQ